MRTFKVEKRVLAVTDLKTQFACSNDEKMAKVFVLKEEAFVN